MAETLKVLGQVAPVASTLTTLYTVPASTSVSSSSIVVCNRGSKSDTFRVAIAVAGAADSVEQYIFFDKVLPKNDSVIATIGTTLAATDVVRVFAGTNDLSFSIFGAEIT